MSHRFVSIPPPEGTSIYKIATFACPDGYLEFYWWIGKRNVIVHRLENDISSWGVWNGGADATIPQTICAALNVSEVKVSNLFEHDGGHSKAFGTDLISAFPTCEWSDYACDRMVISGTVAIRRNRTRSDSFDGNDPHKNHHDFGAGFEMG